MWRKALKYGIIMISAALLIVLFVWRPPFTSSISPDGSYEVKVWAQRGAGLLNVSEHVKIVVKKTSSLQRKTIYTEISNDDERIEPERNIYMFWETDQLTIILLGCEQMPEIITVSLEKEFPYERHQYDIPQNVSDTILAEYGIKISDTGLV